MDTFVASIASSVITFFLGRISGQKKNKLDIETERLVKVEKTVGIYEKLSNKIVLEYEALSAKYHILNVEVQELKQENEELRQEVQILNIKLNIKNKE